MSLLRDMDLYKGIVLVSLLLLPAGWYWSNHLTKQIELCEKSIRESTRQGGYLEQIGKMQKQIELIAQNQLTTSDSIKEPRTYFEGQIMTSAKGLATNDFTTDGPKQEPSGMAGKGQADDYVMSIEWGKTLKVDMEFVYAVIFNCESGARRADAGGQAPPSVWRLRNLSLVNASIERNTIGRNAPPPELGDEWHIADMKFARREPKRGK
ncbi:MAG: hypothetical protein H6835_16130 [Planctomycetes bacterium]|nr:hypothetical protein [Planctomycetota bacterium]